MEAVEQLRMCLFGGWFFCLGCESRWGFLTVVFLGVVKMGVFFGFVYKFLGNFGGLSNVFSCCVVWFWVVSKLVFGVAHLMWIGDKRFVSPVHFSKLDITLSLPDITLIFNRHHLLTNHHLFSTWRNLIFGTHQFIFTRHHHVYSPKISKNDMC